MQGTSNLINCRLQVAQGHGVNLKPSITHPLKALCHLEKKFSSQKGHSGITCAQCVHVPGVHSQHEKKEGRKERRKEGLKEGSKEARKEARKQGRKEEYLRSLEWMWKAGIELPRRRESMPVCGSSGQAKPLWQKPNKQNLTSARSSYSNLGEYVADGIRMFKVSKNRAETLVTHGK